MSRCIAQVPQIITWLCLPFLQLLVFDLFTLLPLTVTIHGFVTFMVRYRTENKGYCRNIDSPDLVLIWYSMFWH
ncbi:hypothetical protein ACN38_g203 [Penicillium nordicum]|uniref:Uncharacterized protein n=1 Tax=Penicillium nordicum TaxID=229535 RepID=A0A0N0S052_9EURO|nr:hypothetical protein ACN38_g203 [Penicillium nordicum]